MARRLRSIVLTSLAILGVAIPTFVVRTSPASSTPSRLSAPQAALPTRPPRAARNETVGVTQHTIGLADGVIPKGSTVSVFDEGLPAVGKLDEDLLDALQRAATDAAAVDVRFRVNSGWRSPAYQQRLLQAAVAKYGSLAVAERWVATPDTSAHVSGDAVDIGPATAAAWLSRHGAAYGLCRTYRNETWHFELRPTAITQGCPAMYADATQDPRMQG